MHIVLVHIHIKPEFREAFIQATLENARNSIQEEGIARFDFLQQKEDPNRFTLVEVYYTESDQEKTPPNRSLSSVARNGGRDDGGAAPGSSLFQYIP